MRTRIIGLVGKKKSGKDTAFGILSEGVRAARVSFADALKHEVAFTFGVSIEDINHRKDLFREMLQQWGQLRKELNGRDYWIDRVKPLIDAVTGNNAADAIIFTDVRFKFEAKFVKSLGGTLVRIVRESVEDGDRHESETELEEIACDHTVENNGNISQFAIKLNELNLLD